MFVEAKPMRRWSDIGLAALIASIVATLLLSIADAAIKGSMYGEGSGKYYFLTTLVSDLRFLFEQGFYAATLFFVGAKFFETRTIFTIGFDTLDRSKIALSGPDENNVVWIGHRYATRLEAETIAAAMSERLKDSGNGEAKT